MNSCIANDWFEIIGIRRGWAVKRISLLESIKYLCVPRYVNVSSTFFIMNSNTNNFPVHFHFILYLYLLIYLFGILNSTSTIDKEVKYYLELRIHETICKNVF